MHETPTSGEGDDADDDDEEKDDDDDEAESVIGAGDTVGEKGEGGDQGKSMARSR